MHSNVYESIGFKVGIMIDTITLCIFMPVYLTLTFTYGLGGERKRNMCTHFLIKFSIGLDGIWHLVEVC